MVLKNKGFLITGTFVSLLETIWLGERGVSVGAGGAGRARAGSEEPLLEKSFINLKSQILSTLSRTGRIQRSPISMDAALPDVGCGRGRAVPLIQPWAEPPPAEGEPWKPQQPPTPPSAALPLPSRARGRFPAFSTGRAGTQRQPPPLGSRHRV